MPPKNDDKTTLFVNINASQEWFMKQQQVIPPLPEQQFHKKIQYNEICLQFLWKCTSIESLSSPGDLSKTGYNKAANIAVRFLTKYSFENLYL